MPGNFQQTIVVGTVGTVQDLRYTQNGTAVQGFSVAVNEYWNDQQTNERREKTTWYSASAWGSRAETLNKYLQVGGNIMLTGTVSARAYTNNNGDPAASLDLKVDTFQLLGNRGGSEGGQSADNETEQPAELDDIPF